MSSCTSTSKAPDVVAHRKDPLGKIRAIEALDVALGPVVERVANQSDLIVVVTGDHATPSSGPLIHSGEAVPILLAGGPNVLSDPVSTFHERGVIRGGLGHIRGTDVMPLLLNATDRIRLHGIATPSRSPAVLAVAARTVSAEGVTARLRQQNRT